MKNVIFLLLLFCLIIGGCKVSNESYLRVHIRANSNTETDQNIKYFIKDIVVEYLSPLMTDCKSKNDVIKVINDNLHSTKDLIDNVLKENGFEYKSSIEINNEFFPTRTYEDVTLYADYYDALIIKLGTGEGDNWWCVMYPNLCFDEIENVVYKSKIVEIIKKIKG